MDGPPWLLLLLRTTGDNGFPLPPLTAGSSVRPVRVLTLKLIDQNENMEATMELVKEFVFYIFSFAFLLGLFLHLATGSVRAIQYCLGGLTAIFIVGAIVGLVLSGGMLIILLFQLIIVVLVLFFTIIAGALCGGGIRMLLDGKRASKNLSEHDIADYVTVTEFCLLEGVEEERALARIQSGFYKGGCLEGCWYVHKSELA